tara:strand:- start:739 stop:855 length:117 start_codon:yes stop_codon:yes gene_type:complete
MITTKERIKKDLDSMLKNIVKESPRKKRTEDKEGKNEI